jgi:FtsH-binding integral membrane protein
MIPNVQPTYGLGADALVVRNRVLRNTYWLLALSMIPTVLGAVLGVMFQIPTPTSWMGFLVFIGIVVGFVWAIEKNKESSLGVVLLLGFTFVLGVFLTPLLTRTLGYSNGGSLIMMAFGGTAVVFAGMASYATVTKRDFTGMGKYLFIGMLILLVAAFANIFLQLPALAIGLSVLVIALFSFWIVYDVQRIVNGGETNYVTATLGLYLNIYYIFSHLLSLLGIVGGDD